MTVSPHGARNGPFVGLRTQLSGLLHVDITRIPGQTAQITLVANDVHKPYLPGQPRIRLPIPTSGAGIGHIQDTLRSYLRRSHLTMELDGILPFMKYIFVSAHFIYARFGVLYHQRVSYAEEPFDCTWQLGTLT